MHSGFLVEDGDFTKKGVDIEALINNSTNCVELIKLAEKLEVTSIAEFAGKMLEGTPEVVFSIE